MHHAFRLALCALALSSCSSSTVSDNDVGGGQAGSDATSANAAADSTSGGDTGVLIGPGVDAEGADADLGDDTSALPDDTAVSAPDAGATTCAGETDGTRCERDADPCTIDVCAAGTCVATGVFENCSAAAAQDPCWTFKCTPKLGCERSVFAKGIACDDGNACTVDDRCQAGVKACFGDGIPVDDSNTCTADTCLEGTVSHQPLDGPPCANGAAVGQCVEGACSVGGCTAIDGGWSVWSWSACSKPCGGGTRFASRSCTSPTPVCGGAQCQGEDTASEACNTDACPPATAVTECPAGLPFAQNTACQVASATTAFGKVVNSSKAGDTYGVKLVAGPAGSVAALYAQQEWFERFGDDGTLLQAPVSLSAKNPSVAPTALGDMGFPAFYGPALGFDGESYVVARSAQLTPDLHLYAVDGTGTLTAGPITVGGPSGFLAGDQGPALQWTGDAWLASWRVYDASYGSNLAVVRLTKDLAVDGAFGTSGLVVLEGGDRHPEIAVSGDGQVAAIVTGEINFQLTVLNAVTGDVIARTPGTCQGGSTGTNGDGNDVVWNEALGEFGVLLSSQGAGLCDVNYTSVNATIVRVSTDGTWIGSPLPVLCGFPIGAGFRGGIAAWPNGRYGVAMQRYHTKPYCVDPYPNGTQGVGSFDLVAVDPNSGDVSVHKTATGVPSTYSQTDLVWTGTKMVAMTPMGITSGKAGYVFED